MSADRGRLEPRTIAVLIESPTEPLFDNSEHFILDLGATVVAGGVMECLENLTKCQHGECYKRPPISNTLVMTLSGFESFNQLPSIDFNGTPLKQMVHRDDEPRR